MQQDFNDITINKPAILAEITEQFYRYEQALISNDIETLDSLFFDNIFTIRYGATENLYGIEAIKAFRQGRNSKNLMRKLHNTVITSYGDNMAVAATEFSRDNSDKIGRQMQTWLKIDSQWKIVAAHVSFMQ